MNGTADEKTMLNYMESHYRAGAAMPSSRPCEPYVPDQDRSHSEQTVMYFRNPFKLVPIGGEGGIADIADKFTRNEIASSNEIRQIVGWKPSKEPKADQLVNANMPQGDTGVPNARRRSQDPTATMSKRDRQGTAEFGVSNGNSPDLTGQVLTHEPSAYDPVKAHAYYLRTRKLKGGRRARSKLQEAGARAVGGTQGEPERAEAGRTDSPSWLLGPGERAQGQAVPAER